MNQEMIDARFGIMKLQGEELVFSARPSGFVRYCLVYSAMTIIGVLALPLVWLGAVIARDKFRYWLTNRRVILCSGFIGYKIRSIPLERVSDVSLSRTLPEMMAGVSSIMIRDMTGESEQGASLVAIHRSPELQRQILDEVQKVNARTPL